MKKITNLIFLLFLALNFPLFASSNLEKISIQLNWKYQFEYAGFIIAKEKGYYEDIGFDVDLKEFTNETKTFDDMLNNKTTFAISDSLFMIERQDFNVVLLANYLKQSPLVIATNKTVTHPRDLESKLFMSSKERIINTPIYFMFRHLGIDFNKINFRENTYNIQDLIDGNTDAMEVYKSNELYTLKNENIPYNILDPKDYGFNSGAINMFTIQKNIDRYGKEKIKAFIKATNKGWLYALNNQMETVQLISSKYNKSLQKSADALKFEAIEIKKLFLLDQFKIGDINKNEIYRWNDILSNYGFLKKENRYTTFLFNDNWREKNYTKDEIYLLIALSCFIIFIMVIILYFSKSREKLLRVKNKEIEEQQKIFETLFNDSSDGILIINDTKILDGNKSVIQIFGFNKKEDLLKSSILKLSPTYQSNNELSSEKMNQMISLTQKTGSASFEWIHRKVNQEEFWTDISLTRMQLNNQDVIHGVIRDISLNKKLAKDIEEKNMQLFEQSKLASMGEMIGNIAHQWRQPLSVISTGATGLQVQKELDLLTDEVFYEVCEAINDNAQYLSKTIDDFRNFIKGDREKNTFIVTNQINSFLSLVDSSIKNENINIILDLEDEIEINGYENELTQCLMNIFNNAKDAFSENNLEKKYIFISTWKQEDKILIKMQDNAGGIPQNVLPKIFEPYFTTKHQQKGTGLGLNMTYSLIVDGMKGSIEAINKSFEYEDVLYKGAEFTITLPAK